jgi:hypothetical protein
MDIGCEPDRSELVRQFLDHGIEGRYDSVGFERSSHDVEFWRITKIVSTGFKGQADYSHSATRQHAEFTLGMSLPSPGPVGGTQSQSGDLHRWQAVPVLRLCRMIRRDVRSRSPN